MWLPYSLSQAPVLIGAGPESLSPAEEQQHLMTLVWGDGVRSLEVLFLCPLSYKVLHNLQSGI